MFEFFLKKEKVKFMQMGEAYSFEANSFADNTMFVKSSYCSKF